VIKTAAVVAVSALALVGCSKDALEADQIEEKIGEGLVTQGVDKPQSIDCPDDLPAEEGATVECTMLMVGGTKHAITVVTTEVDGDEVRFDWKIDPQPMS
jgi:Domain of unknown function (DUF4333)